MTSEYRKEFFDREYGVGEVCLRIWSYMRKYRLRIFLGLVFGLINACALIPFYQTMQPAIASAGGEAQVTQAVSAAESQQATVKPDAKRKSKLDRQIQSAAKLPDWFAGVAKVAEDIGFPLVGENGDMKGAMMFLVIVVIPIILAMRLLLGFLFTYCLSWASAKAVADLKCDMLRHVDAQSMEFFGRVDMGQVMMRVTVDPQNLQLVMNTIIVELIMAPFEMIVSVWFVVNFAITNHMGAALVLLGVGAPLFFGPIIIIAKRLRKISKRMLEQGSLIGSKIHEDLTCGKRIKAYHTEAYEDAQFRLAYDKQLKLTKRSLKIGLLTNPTVEAVGLIVVGTFVVWCFIFRIPLSNVVPMFAPLMILYKPIKALGKVQIQIQETMAGLSRVFSLLDLHMELPVDKAPVAKPTFDDRIAFDNVTFRYATQERDAVRSASFEIRKGAFVAVVGGTGSGKTTLSGLLARFYDPREGRVTIDGIDIRKISNSDLRALIGDVLQDALLFNDTILENIRYGSPNATEEEVIAAAKMANAHEFIMSQPEGYGRNVGDKGSALSGGERQRIAIARAILKNPPILILDEATSALDTVTERLVQEAIEKLMRNRTTFAIAHRLSTIRNADMILVMREGEIVERGTHEELYAANGVYRQLCDMQTT